MADEDQKRAFPQNLYIEQGSYYDIGFDWTEDDGITPLPDTPTWPDQWEAHAQIRPKRGSPLLFLNLHTGTDDEGRSNGIVLTAPNMIDVHIRDDQAAGLPKDGEWDLYLRELPTGEWFRFVEGEVTVDKRVTVTFDPDIDVAAP